MTTLRDDEIQTISTMDPTSYPSADADQDDADDADTSDSDTSDSDSGDADTDATDPS